MPIQRRHIQRRGVQRVIDAPHRRTKDIRNARETLAGDGVRLADDIGQVLGHGVRGCAGVVGHHGPHGGAVHQSAGHGGFDGLACCAEVLVCTKCAGEVGGGDAEVDSGGGRPGEVVVEGSGGDEGAGLEELLGGGADDARGDCGGAVEPFWNVFLDRPGGVVAVHGEDWWEVSLDMIYTAGCVPSNSFPTSMA